MKDPHRPWALWRRIWYGTGFGTFWVCVGVLVYFTNFYQPPTCFDRDLNGGEVEVDAGGPCVRIPQSQVLIPQVAWAESFEVTPGRYNAVAYVEHRDLVAGTAELPYTFTFIAEDGQVLAERRGATTVAPNSTVPVFESMVITDESIAETRLTLDLDTIWVPLLEVPGPFRTVDVDLQDEDTRPRLVTRIENQDLDTVDDVDIVATIFNDLGVPVTASQTFVERFPGRSTQSVTLTWPQPIGKTVRSCSIPTDVLVGIDVSGSMNNDADAPPQPITDAVAAASSFVNNLGILDQVGVVTFATNATLVSQLVPQNQHAAVGEIVTAVTISPAEETGYTNTAAAFEFAQLELSSNRHNTNARRAFVVLTDGLPTAAGDTDAEAAALAAAASLRAEGIDVYAIGLGAGVNEEFVRSLAGEPARAYLAPSRADLTDIYAQITASLCEVGPTKIEVISKPDPVFAPLR